MKATLLLSVHSFFPQHCDCSVEQKVPKHSSCYTPRHETNGTHISMPRFPPPNTSLPTIPQAHQAHFLFFPSVGQRQTACWIR